MDLRQLRYFIAVVEAGSVTDASRRLHVVQPAVSQRISALEEELGVQLLVRTRVGVTATPAGQELYGRAQTIVKQVAAAEAATREKAGYIGGSVRIGLLRSLSNVVAVPLFKALRAQYPEIVPEIVVGYSSDLIHGVNAMRLDLALQLVKPEGASEARIIFRESICLVGSHALLQGKLDGMGLKDLQGIPLLVSPTQPIHAELQSLAQEAGISFHILGSLESSEAIATLCREGIAATFIAETAARHLTMSSGSGLAMRRIKGFDRGICVYSHPEIMKSSSVQACETVLIDTLKAQCLTD